MPLSRAKVQIDLAHGRKLRGRPSHLARLLEQQRDLFPVELAVACHAPYLIPGAAMYRAADSADAAMPVAALAAPAGGTAPLGKSISGGERSGGDEAGDA